MGLSTLGAVIVLQLFGKTDLPKLAYDSIPESVQEALPEQLGAKQHKNLPQPFNLGAFVQKAQGGVQREGLALQLDAPKPDKPSPPQDKVKAERQANFEKSKQAKTARNEQTKREKEQRQKQKEKEKDVAERKLKEQKEKERKEAEKRKKFRDQALVGGSIFGMSALTFGKWQLVASLGAVIFRTIGGPTILSSVLRTPGYIIGRGVRVVEWNVAEHPDGPDGDLASMKLRALTPDGIRMAIAKEYGLSNYREVRQVSHWVTTAVPHFFEPMRTAAAFKMLPNPAFVVWSRHPPTGRHTLPTRSNQAPTSDTASQDPLAGLSPDQVTAVMLKTISGVAAASRCMAEADHLRPSGAERVDHHSNGSRLTHSGRASTGHNTAGETDADHAPTSAVQADGHQQPSQGVPGSSELARQESGRHASTSANTTTPSHHQHRGSNGAGGPSLPSSAQGVSQPAGAATHPQESADHQPARVSVRHGAEERQQKSDEASCSDSRYGEVDCWSATALEQPQNSALSNDEQADSSRTHSLQNGQQPLTVAASSSSGNENGSSPGMSSQHLPQGKGQPGQHWSGEDEVAGVLHDTNGPQAQPQNPDCWDGPDALQALCASPSVSASAWSERLQLPNGYVPVSEAEEEALVLAVGMSGDYMLSLFRAYAPHDVLTFMHFARRHCLKATSVC